MTDYRAYYIRGNGGANLPDVHRFWLRSQAEACRINVVTPFGSECRADGVFAKMPIRPELRPLYPPHWRELSRLVRFERAKGCCQACHRPHLVQLRCLPDGRWFDEGKNIWRDRRGRDARWPDLVEATRLRTTRVVLAAAHLDSNPSNNRLANLRALCHRCHMLHDRAHHLTQRWITYRRRWALGDFFLGSYSAASPRIGPPGKDQLRRVLSRRSNASSTT